MLFHDSCLLLLEAPLLGFGGLTLRARNIVYQARGFQIILVHYSDLRLSRQVVEDGGGARGRAGLVGGLGGRAGWAGGRAEMVLKY